MQRSIILLDNRHIQKLHQLAIRNRVTASWILRALYFRHREYAIAHRPQRVRQLETYCSPFTLCWHGDRQVIRDFLGGQGLEISAVIRFLLEAYLRGEIRVDLGDVRLVKREHSPEELPAQIIPLGATGCMTMLLVRTRQFQPADYWPINNATLIAMSARGRARVKKSRKFGRKPIKSKNGT